MQSPFPRRDGSGRVTRARASYTLGLAAICACSPWPWGHVAPSGRMRSGLAPPNYAAKIANYAGIIFRQKRDIMPRLCPIQIYIHYIRTYMHYLRALYPFLGASECASITARYGNPKFRIYEMRPIESRSLEIFRRYSTESSLEMGNEIDRVAVTGNCRQY